MKKVLKSVLNVYPSTTAFDMGMLFFRVVLSLELIAAHGLKKIGFGVAIAEQIPNPLGLPESVNSLFAISANLFFPILVIFGFLTRLAVVPILAVTLTGYLVLHWNDAALVKDTPFMYSLAYLLVLVLGPGKYSMDFLISNEISHED